jgi:hypothetical protein
LRLTLEEETATDKKLTELASSINLEAAESEDSQAAAHSKKSKAARM